MSGQFRMFLELVRFSHTIFAMPFALLSALLAWQAVPFRPLDLLGTVLCMITARNTAMAFNRLADRELDALNPRTAARHLPSRRLTVRTVAAFTLLNVVGFVASTAIFLASDNPWPLRLSLPVIGFLCLYSYTKRFTSLSHFWLGSSLMLSPIATWIAIRGLDDLQIPFTLGAAVLFWVAGFDIIYACQDLDFDRRARLFSVPARFGCRASLTLAAICHLATIGFLVALHFICPGLGAIYLTGVAAVALLLIYEHAIVSPSDLSRVNQAFFAVNGIISIGLLLVVAVQLFANR